MNVDSAKPAYRSAFLSVTLLFFMWGFITCMNDLLIPKFKADFALSQFEANLVQSAFFGAYFLVSLGYFLVSALWGDPIGRMGYRNGLVMGLVVAGLGCGMFYPAAETRLYPLFLGALVVLGAGVTIIQIAANPYVSILGPEASASSRLNLSQGLNSLGYVIAPLIGGLLLFGSDVYGKGGGVESVKTPYLGLALAFLVLAIAFKWVKLPEFRHEGRAVAGIQAFRHKHFVWGWLAIFFYVGSEVTVGSILINYLMDSSVMGLSEERAAHYLSFYWGGLMIGRLMGAISLGGIQQARKAPLMILVAALSTLVIFANATFKEKFTTGHFIHPAEVVPYVMMVLGLLGCFIRGRLGPEQMIGWFAMIAAGLTAVAMGAGGSVALWSVVGIGLFNSIMWSNIFTLSIRGLGKDTAQGSSLLVMMIVGGALMPALQGKLMDLTGVRASLGIVLVGYAYLAWFGWIGSRIGRSGIKAGLDAAP